jgi:hypothetical protein
MRISSSVPMAMSAFLLVASSLISGCYFAPLMPPQGNVYMNISAPLDLDLNNTSLGSKEGEACTESILGMVAWGDASTETAAANGGISKINYADYKYLNVLGVYHKLTVKVYGD